MAPEYKDYYKTLGVERSSGKDEIAKAYKKLAKKYHPDLNPGDKNAEEKFKDITEAYEVLKDDEKRKLYDQLGPDWKNASQFGGFGGGNPFGGGQFNYGPHMDGSGFSDFFETLFGGGARGFGGGQQDPFGGFRSRQQRGRDVEAEVEIPLETARHGGKRTVTFQTGDRPSTLEINIRAGTREGSKLRIGGKGYPGMNGAPAGDLFLKVRFAPHPLFTVDGTNLVHEAHVKPWVAALGGRIRVPTLDGEVEISIPAGTSSGKKFRLRGKGLGPAGSQGDLFIRIAIDIPGNLSDRESALWRELAELDARAGRN